MEAEKRNYKKWPEVPWWHRYFCQSCPRPLVFLFLHSRNSVGGLQQLRAWVDRRRSSPCHAEHQLQTARRGGVSPIPSQCPQPRWSTTPPFPEADQQSPGKSTHPAPREQQNPLLNQGSAPPGVPQEPWPVAQHGQAADALWCKKSVGWTSPTPHAFHPTSLGTLPMGCPPVAALSR